MSEGGSRPPRFPLVLDQMARGAPVARPAPREPLRPQRHLHESAKDASRQSVPQGLGLDSAGVRQRMVQRLRAVELLFDGQNARSAGHLGCTLEVGTGCGYQTALLAHLARRVVSIERLRPLFDKARENLAGWRMDHVRLVFGDGMLGHAPNAPYDSLIAAAGGDEVPAAWLDQLAVGGRLVAPMHRSGGRGQVLVVIDKRASGVVRAEHEAVHFVPLKSGTV